MGSQENIEIIPIPFGSYSADAILGKAKDLSVNSINIRYDLFGGIESVLGNSPFNVNQVGGGYGLGGDVFQYIRKDRSFDVILSRQKAEGKVYVVPHGIILNNTLGGVDFPSGTPLNGDALLYQDVTVMHQLPQNTTTQFNLGTATNIDTSGNQLKLKTASGIPFGTDIANGKATTISSGSGGNLAVDGNDSTAWVSASTNNVESIYMDLTANRKIGKFRLKYLQGTSRGQVFIEYSTDATNWFVITNDILTSDDLTYTFVAVNARYVRARSINGGINSPFTVYSFEVYEGYASSGTFDSQPLDFGVVTPTKYGNFTANILNTSPEQIDVYVATSDNNITYTSFILVGSCTTAVTNISYPIDGTGGLAYKRYLKYRIVFSSVGSQLFTTTVNTVYVGGQWVSATQNLTAGPIAWDVFSVGTNIIGGGTIVYEIDTSSDGTTWDGFTIVPINTIPVIALKQYIRYRVSFNILNTVTDIAYLLTLNLGYILTAGGSLTQITGWSGTGFNSYFGVLNNKMLISDGSVPAMYWTGTGNFQAIATAPSGMFPEVHYSRYFLAYSSAFPSRVWWSNDDDPLTWNQSAQFIDINPDDGDSITGIKSYGGVLYVFKHKHAYLVQGNDFNPTLGNYSVQSMQQLPGCESHKSICEANSNLYWYSDQGMIEYNGSYTPNYVGRGIIDQTVKNAGFRQNLGTYNQISSVNNKGQSELWITFGHTIYTYNYVVQKWNRILFDNSTSGNTVFSLATYTDSYSDKILSFTGNNMIEQWDNTATFYIGQSASMIPIQSFYTTDFMDGVWYASKNDYKALLSIRPLTATTLTITHFMDFSTTAVQTQSITCPTSLLPDQYFRVDLAELNGRRLQIKLSCLSGQFGVSDFAIHSEIADSGRL